MLFNDILLTSTNFQSKNLLTNVYYTYICYDERYTKTRRIYDDIVRQAQT